MSGDATAQEMAAIGWIFRSAGLLLFCLTALASGALGWVMAHPVGGETILAELGVPALLGLLFISIDMMSDMALSRRILSKRPKPPRPFRIMPIPTVEEPTCTGS